MQAVPNIELFQWLQFKDGRNLMIREVNKNEQNMVKSKKVKSSQLAPMAFTI